jgi:spore coat protein U-like protein
MSNITRLAPMLIAAAAVAAAAPAMAQSSSTASVTGTMNVTQPLQLSKTTDLTFGTIMRPASGSGNVSIDATTGARTVTGNASGVTGGSNATPTRAAFTVSGEGGMNITVTVPSSMNMTRGGLDPITVSLNSTMGGGQLSGSAGSTGTASFGVGGQLAISNTTPTGAYSGTFNVTVAYN